jgi:hypothetical protein
VTAKGNPIFGARGYSAAPFDVHTLYERFEQNTILLQDSSTKPTTTVVDLVYGGVDTDNPWLVSSHIGVRPRG